MPVQKSNHTAFSSALVLTRYLSAQQAFVNRLHQNRSTNRAWYAATDLGGLVNAAYLVTLRTLGLVASGHCAGDEFAVLRQLRVQVNPDGGFFKCPCSSSSSRRITKRALLAMRLALREVEPANRPVSWFRRSLCLDVGFESQLRTVMTSAEPFFGYTRSQKQCRKWDRDVSLPVRLLVADADQNGPVSRTLWLHPRFAAWLTHPSSEMEIFRQPGRFLHRPFHYQLRESLRAFSILHDHIRRRTACPESGWVSRRRTQRNDGTAPRNRMSAEYDNFRRRLRIPRRRFHAGCRHVCISCTRF
jgi:hypothetical protein